MKISIYKSKFFKNVWFVGSISFAQKVKQNFLNYLNVIKFIK